eukprot:CAMPEP_0172913906 /NCGR_PEP_ID=MMETSP1075-20121228/191307_1 /TAXON_ID=2916 /ORGANISM="Ceratium fusus, Strain PA161109" /LENGTH=79 /DNA_ID=CAMNT_0013772723 /DNA_START=411 /DNA_END=650 /DNA_ORIENTATION=-
MTASSTCNTTKVMQPHASANIGAMTKKSTALKASALFMVTTRISQLSVPVRMLRTQASARNLQKLSSESHMSASRSFNA